MIRLRVYKFAGRRWTFDLTKYNVVIYEGRFYDSWREAFDMGVETFKWWIDSTAARCYGV